MIHRRAFPNLRMYLHKTGTTQRSLAKRVGVDPTHINHILHGRRKPSLDLAAKLAQEANCPMESLLEMAS